MNHNEFLSELIETAKNGTIKNSRYVYAQAIKDLRAGKPLEESSAKFLADCLESLLNDKKNPFFLEKPSKRPKNTDRDIEIAIDYIELKNKEKAIVAKKIIAGMWGIKDETLKTILKNYKVISKAEYEFRQSAKEKNPVLYLKIKLKSESLRIQSRDKKGK